MKKCPKCGAEIWDGSVFCLNCAQELSAKPNVTPRLPRPKKPIIILLIALIGFLAVSTAVAIALIASPSNTPGGLDLPIGTITPAVTDTPVVTDTPIITETPTVTETPVITPTPDVTSTPVHTHSFGEWAIKKVPGCVSTGSAERVCAECGEKEYKNLPAVGHIPISVQAIGATCEKTGLSEGEKCSVCGEVLRAQKVIPALGHEWGEPGYTWSSDNTLVSAVRICSRDQSHKHSETAGVSISFSEPSCTEEGLKTYSAHFTDRAFSDQTKTETIGALGHSFTDGKCSRCAFVAMSVGDIYVFGTFEQDNDLTNGAEPIEWIVLGFKGSKALLISKYALDRKQYNSSHNDVTWKDSSIRKWLNGDFYTLAFTAEEKGRIVQSALDNPDNPKYGTSGGSGTTDRVFALGIDEANEYFTSDDARRCAPTDYAAARGVWTSSSQSVDGRATCLWWLRSPGESAEKAAIVDRDGSVNVKGNQVYVNDDAVRPALFIELN